MQKLLTILAVLLLCVRSDAADAQRPNIVIILTDDMGFSDLGCYGGEIQTPNLDSLAANGVRFTQFYNTARCCPTRASLLTGLYPHQAGMGHMTVDKGENFPGYRGDLNKECRTIAEVLKPAGYRNYAIGKWHVTRFLAPNANKSNWPLQRGFDRYYGIISGAASFFDPFTLTRDNTRITAFADPEYKSNNYYLTDALSDNAVRFVADHVRDHAKDPFFMYVAFTAAHWPMHALPEDIAKYKGKYDQGYEPIRAARLQKSRQLGVVDPGQPMAPQALDWSNVRNREREIACMEVYAAMIDRMDQGVGKIVSELKRTGQFDNTLIFFLQDNGGCAEVIGRAETKDRRDGPRPDAPTSPPMKPTDLQTNQTPPQTRDGYPVRQGPNVFPGPGDSYIAYGRGWANTSNTPFREYKHWVHEGGISTPLIAHWPKGIAAKGELRKQPGHLIDLMATCVDVAGAKYPAGATPLEGKSLTTAFANKPIEREAIYWEHEGNRAVRMGDWKAVAKAPGGMWELYNIANDRVESHDLAREEPKRLDEMVAKWEAYARRAKVFPWIWEPPYQSEAGR